MAVAVEVPTPLVKFVLIEVTHNVAKPSCKPVTEPVSRFALYLLFEVILKRSGELPSTPKTVNGTQAR